MGGCPGCGAPVGDTDMACRQCGRSFVADPSTLAQDPASYSGQQATGPQFGSPNPYAAPGYGAPNAYGAALPPGTTSSEASSALIYAILGLFCLGFVFGSMAIARAKRARITLRQNPGMGGSTQAEIAFYLGWFDVAAWALWLVRFALHR